jgi:hypothetical protein
MISLLVRLRRYTQTYINTTTLLIGISLAFIGEE